MHQFYHILLSQESQPGGRRRRTLNSCLIPNFSSSSLLGLVWHSVAIWGQGCTGDTFNEPLTVPRPQAGFGDDKMQVPGKGGLEAVGEATRGGTNRFYSLLSWVQLMANSWGLFHGAHPQGKASAAQLGGLHPTLPCHSQLLSLSRDLQRAPCSSCVAQTYVFKGSRC